MKDEREALVEKAERDYKALVDMVRHSQSIAEMNLKKAREAYTKWQAILAAGKGE